MSLFHYFDIRRSLKDGQILGEIPDNASIYKKTLNIAWPSAIEAVLVALIGAMDMIMVGGLGVEAISAVGICNQPKFICLAPIFAINTAAIVLIARRKGEGKQKEANEYMKVALIWSAIISVIFCSLSFIFAKEILLFAGAQYDYLDLAIDYYRIVLVSLIFYSIGYTMSGSWRGAGFTRITMVTNLSANIVNIIFNALLINGYLGFPKLGVRGAAIATAIGNLVAFGIGVFSLCNKSGYLYLDLQRIRDFKKKCLEFFAIFRSTFGEQLILRFGFFTYSKVVASLGTSEFAAHQVAMNLMTITFSFGDGLQNANTSLVGQSMGAKRSDMAILYSSASQKIGRMISIVLSLGIFCFSKELCQIFTSDATAIALANVPMKIMAFICLFQIPQVITVGALRGAGDVGFVTKMMLLCVGIIRPGLSYLLAYPLGLGLNGAWIGCFFDQFSRFAYSAWRFKKGKWVSIKV